MSLKLQIASAVSLLVGIASSKDDIEPVADLDLARYAGTWYEVTRDKDNKYEINQSCNLIDYSYFDGE